MMTVIFAMMICTSYDDGEFFAAACSRANVLAALGYDQEDFDNDEENVLGYEYIQPRTLC